MHDRLSQLKGFSLNADSFRREVLLIPNLISLSRIILVIPITIFYKNPSDFAYNTVLVLLVISYLTDFADGYLARRLNAESNLGLLLDPLADKIWTFTMVVLLHLYREMPAWLMLSIILRDLYILTMNWLCYRRCGTIMQSDSLGRLYMVLLGLIVIFYTIKIPDIQLAAYALLGLALATLISYHRNFNRLLTKAPKSTLQAKSTHA